MKQQADRIAAVIEKIGMPAPRLGDPQADAMKKVADALEFLLEEKNHG